MARRCAQFARNKNSDDTREATISSRDVYLVGSVPMASAQEVFEKVSAALGPRIKRLPDGETGERGDWITWLEPVFADNPAFQKSGEFFRVHATGTGRERYALRPGCRAGGRALRQPVLCRHRKGVLRGVPAAQGCRKDRARHQVPGRSGAGAFRDLALSGRRAACADRPDLQRGGQARDRQDRSRDPARRAGDPVRRRVRGVRTSRAQRGEQLRAQQGGDAGDISATSWSISAIACRRISICSTTSATAIRTTATWWSRPT